MAVVRQVAVKIGGDIKGLQKALLSGSKSAAKFQKDCDMPAAWTNAEVTRHERKGDDL